MEPLFGVNGLMVWDEAEIRLREALTAEFAARLRDTMVGLNKAWRFVRTETSVLTPRAMINANYTAADVWVQQDPHREARLDQFRREMAKDSVRAEFIKAQMKLAAETGDLADPRQCDDPEGEMDLDLRRAAGIAGQAENLGITLEYFEDWLGWRNLNQELVLRPETTPGSYAVARHLLDSHQGYTLPLCVWQIGKSFRRENEQPTMHMRLKEFHQLEFQMAYGDDTAMDYHTAVLEPVREMIGLAVGLPTRIVPSERLPAYSLKTTDVEAWTGEKWMELCSISLRKDFPGTVRIQGKKSVIERNVLVCEIAIGMDRIVFARSKAKPLGVEQAPPEALAWTETPEPTGEPPVA